MPSRYHQIVDPAAPNNAHAYALELVGWNRKVLELGAASGHVTRALVERRCQVTSIEFEAESAAELHGIADQVIVGDLNDRDVFAGLRADFDVVLAGDVLEHLLRPHDVLGRAARLLKPGGQMVISLPHVGHVDVRLSLIRGRWDYQTWGLLDSTHTRFFTLDSIATMVREAGLVITDLRRVRVPAFETELAVDRSGVPTEVLELALADPEAETYQFVFSATVDSGDYRVRRLADRTLELEADLDRLRVAHAALEIDHGRLGEVCDGLRARVGDDERRFAEREGELTKVVVARDTELAEVYRELEVARRIIKRLDHSVSWQLFQRVRGRLFAMAGGERSPAVRGLQVVLRGLGRIVMGGRHH
jgi:2-polyprenyl-3-methyl-5-hydroxy-6-metoxy-1,4-benzoquinol methylase